MLHKSFNKTQSGQFANRLSTSDKLPVNIPSIHCVLSHITTHRFCLTHRSICCGSNEQIGLRIVDC